MAKTKTNDQNDFAKFDRAVADGLTEALLEGPPAPSVPAVEVTPPTTGVSALPVVTDVDKVAVSSNTAKSLVTLHSGRQMPAVTPKEGVDPLLVECYTVVRQLVVGAVLNPWDRLMIAKVDVLALKLKRAVEG